MICYFSRISVIVAYLLFIAFFTGNVSSQQYIAVDSIYYDNIKTVLIHRQGWQLAPPIIQFESGDQLMVSFDDLNENQENYYYTIHQCNADWTMSDMVQQDYLEGFYDNPIAQYQYSTNTTIPYIHYSFQFPNEEIQIKLSGNYILLVYRNFDKEDIVFTRRFYVYESLVTINAMAKRPMSAGHFDKGQQVDVSIDHAGYSIPNPQEEIKMVILQNMDENTRNDQLKPTYIRNNELVYDYIHENIFQGNSEFRYFDIKSLRYQSEYIKSITYDYHFHHIQLITSEERHYGKYFYNEDINGKYLVDVQEFDDPEISADYVKVHFTLKYNSPIMAADLYVYGALSDWKTDDRCKMTYNTETSAYEADMLLKQGYYNYLYATSLDNKPATLSYIEGSHHETENDYFIFVYHRPFHLRYDRLIGAQVVNSVRRSNEN